MREPEAEGNIERELTLNRTVEEICEVLTASFPDGAPTDAAVRSQGSDYFPQHWTSRWPAHLPLPAALHSSELRRYINRSGLFAMAEETSSSEDILNLYVSICAWGTGTQAQRVARVVKPLHEEGALDSLQRSFTAARSLDPIEAYRRLNMTGEDRVKGFGPAFFTKWLYFAAYNDPTRTQQLRPLILDERVSNALGWPPISGRRPSSDYAQYLETAAKINSAWAPNSPSHAIEYALFQIGKTTTNTSETTAQ